MVTLSFTIFSGQKNYNRAHMLFQVLCGFEPIFYTTHPNEEPNFDSNYDPYKAAYGSMPSHWIFLKLILLSIQKLS